MRREDLPDGTRLDWVSPSCTGSMRLEEPRQGWIKPGLGVDMLDERRLGSLGRLGDTGDLPSEFVEEFRMTARITSPSRMASETRFSTRTPKPSPRA